MSAVAVVAIDGPSGAGKGTISRRLANRLHWHLLDSGALYRLVALSGLRRQLDPADADGHARLASAMQVQFGSNVQGGELVRLEGEDVTAQLRAEQTGAGASRVAAWPQVRTALLGRQRDFAQPPGLVADGRDMGTVVFPAAPLKVYLTASLEERARRRYNQLNGKESGVSLAALLADIAERDRRDEARSVAPLRAADDAMVIDSTALSVDAVVDQIVLCGRARGLWA